jgi:hypothetical protein
MYQQLSTLNDLAAQYDAAAEQLEAAQDPRAAGLRIAAKIASATAADVAAQIATHHQRLRAMVGRLPPYDLELPDLAITDEHWTLEVVDNEQRHGLGLQTKDEVAARLEFDRVVSQMVAYGALLEARLYSPDRKMVAAAGARTTSPASVFDPRYGDKLKKIPPADGTPIGPPTAAQARRRLETMRRAGQIPVLPAGAEPAARALEPPKSDASGDTADTEPTTPSGS